MISEEIWGREPGIGSVSDSQVQRGSGCGWPLGCEEEVGHCFAVTGWLGLRHVVSHASHGHPLGLLAQWDSSHLLLPSAGSNFLYPGHPGGSPNNALDGGSGSRLVVCDSPSIEVL